MRPPATLVSALSAVGIHRRLRAKWLRGVRMVQLCVTVYLYGRVVPQGACRNDRAQRLTSLFESARSCGIPQENPAVAALAFVERLTRATACYNGRS